MEEELGGTQQKRPWWTLIVEHSMLSVTIVFLLITVLKFCVDRFLLFQTPLLPIVEGEMLDSIATAFLGSLAFGIFLRMTLLRRRYMEKELRKVSIMNHHVRNALQVIFGIEMMRPEPAQDVIDSVTRIENVIRELYPASIPEQQ
jgi:hypothetical protein